ncbi:MAG: hypothetical protein LC776_00675 [Acidobacteria bacterium]|nr:hypothetical protein [Acidobacteriota bacterium]
MKADFQLTRELTTFIDEIGLPVRLIIRVTNTGTVGNSVQRDVPGELRRPRVA